MKKTSNLSLSFVLTRQKKYPFGDAIAAAALFAGILGTFCTTFSLTVYLPLLMLGGALVIAAAFLPERQRRIRQAALLVLLVWGVGMTLAFLPDVRSGFCRTANAVSDALGTAQRKVLTHFAATEGNVWRQTTFFLLPLALLLGYLCAWIVKNGNLLLATLFVLGLVVLQAVTGGTAALGWGLCLFGAEALLIVTAFYRGRGFRLRTDGGATVSAAGSVALILCVTLGLSALFIPVRGYEKSAIASGTEAALETAAGQARYGKAENRALPEGDFRNLGDLVFPETTALQVVMSQPDSLYLRGFVGESYTGDGWTSLDKQRLYTSANLFYWLHQNGFYGQTQLASAAALLDGRLTSNDLNTLSVHTVDASRKYVYAPYELCSADAALLDSENLGDIALLSRGFRGRNSYTYTALPNQVKRYTELVSFLRMDAETPSDELSSYLVSESQYNTFVYDAYTALPESVESYLTRELGEPETENGQHMSYQKAKQRILEYLTANASYTEIPKETRDDGEDFLRFFLESGAGYSVHYATAAALMFRHYGIPARYVEGYLIFPENVEGQLENAVLTVPEAHAHAWVEFYQDGIGWVPFEVTPPYIDRMEQPDIFQGYDTGENESDGDDKASEEMTEDNYIQSEEKERPDVRETAKTALLSLLGLLLAAILFLLARYLKKRRELRQRLARFDDASTAKGICAIFAYCRELLGDMGIKSSGASVHSLTPRVAKLCGEDTAALYGECAAIWEEAAFSTHEMNEEQREKLKHLHDALLVQLKKNTKFFRRLVIRFIVVRY